MINPASLPVDRIFPRGRIFPFSFYSVHGRRDLALVASRGASLVGPVYQDREALEEATEEVFRKFFRDLPALGVAGWRFPAS